MLFFLVLVMFLLFTLKKKPGKLTAKNFYSMPLIVTLKYGVFTERL